MKTIVAFGDVHSSIEELKSLEKEVLNQDSFAVFLGDLFDRNDSTKGLATYLHVKRLVYENRAILLKGNHEEMLEKALIDYVNNNRLPYVPNNYSFHSLLKGCSKNELKNIADELHALPSQFQCQINDKIFYFAHSHTYRPESFVKDTDYFWADIEPKFFNNGLGQNTMSVVGHVPTPKISNLYEYGNIDSKKPTALINPSKTVAFIDCACGYRSQGGRLCAMKINETGDYKFFYR